MKLSIIIVSYNTAKLTIQCLESIAGTLQNDELSKQTEVIIVDNHSSDDSVAQIKAFKRSSSIPITLLANPTNTGFAAANNQGILQAKGKYVLLLNSDTIVQPQALQNIVAAADDPANATIGIFAATLLNPDQTIQPQGGDLPTLPALFCFAFLLDDLPLIGRYLPSHQHTGKRFQQSATPIQTKGWVAATAVLIRSELFTSVGVLDEAIFMYAEDLEYCWRARNQGWQSAIVANARIIHLGSKSSSSAYAIKGEYTSLKYVLKKYNNSYNSKLSLILLKQSAHMRFWIHSLLKNPARAVYKSIYNDI